ncbi:MAG: hypothetical protein ACRD6N_07465, partial [Pyrinomonadaceae bacterium]
MTVRPTRSQIAAHVWPRVFSGALLAIVLLSQGLVSSSAQKERSRRAASQSSHLRESMSPEEREMVERAIEVVCLERLKDPKGSHPIDEMQGRPSLSVRSPEAIAGAERAQRLLPLAKDLVISSMRQLSSRYNFNKTPGYGRRLQRAIVRVQAVTRVRPDVESRDNASVFLR